MVFAAPCLARLARWLPVVLDASAMSFVTVFCSAGRRGLEIEIAPADLVRAADAKVASIARPDQDGPPR